MLIACFKQSHNAMRVPLAGPNAHSTLCQSTRWCQGTHSRLVMHSMPIHSANSCRDSGTTNETLQGLGPTELHQYTATRSLLQKIHGPV